MFKNFILLLVIGVSGCTFNPQAVSISPDLKPTGVIHGEGKNVVVTVSDERASQSLGQRGAGNVGADLTVQGDLTEIIQSSVESGLQKQGFNLSNAGSSLKVEIRNLDYKFLTGMWSGTIRTECGLKAICSAGGKSYDKFYRGKYEKSVQVAGTSAENNTYVSSSVSDAVNQLINDPELGKCLSQ
ncbi:MAG TPA: YajG family lipoprotein [Cellvibrionaceae bacterium]